MCNIDLTKKKSLKPWKNMKMFKSLSNWLKILFFKLPPTSNRSLCYMSFFCPKKQLYFILLINTTVGFENELIRLLRNKQHKIRGKKLGKLKLVYEFKRIVNRLKTRNQKEIICKQCYWYLNNMILWMKCHQWPCRWDRNCRVHLQSQPEEKLNQNV